jgi:hypothetical protein
VVTEERIGRAKLAMIDAKDKSAFNSCMWLRLFPELDTVPRVILVVAVLLLPAAFHRPAYRALALAVGAFAFAIHFLSSEIAPRAAGHPYERAKRHRGTVFSGMFFLVIALVAFLWFVHTGVGAEFFGWLMHLVRH